MSGFFRSGASSNSPAPAPNSQSPYSRVPPDSSSSFPRGQRPLPPPSSDYSAYEKRAAAQSVPARTASARGGVFGVVNCPTSELALTNCVFVNSSDFANDQVIIVKRHFPVNARHDPTRSIAPGSIGFSSLQRQWIGLSAQGDSVDVTPLDPSLRNALFLQSIDIEVGFVKRNVQVTETYDGDEMTKAFTRAYSNVVFSPGQILVFDFHGQNIRGLVKGVQLLDLGGGSDGGAGVPFGQLMEDSDTTFIKAADSPIKLKSSAKKAPANAILAPNFKFEDMGIGGLDNEFATIFRRAFASRVFPPGLIKKLGIQHVKGLLLFGPPGTGKTLMARQIGKILNAREPKIVNGPEILDKFVGKSEENIRKLFADAEAEYKSKGDESGLHIIIFDELDAICKQRGSGSAGGTGVGDTVVNQLLSKMDGVDQLNNVLVIGMTNRKELIDEALLRPGRLEVHVEIALPDEHGRLQILGIQTTDMRKNGVMDRDVALEELAANTKNFSGAELAGLVKSATSFAFGRHVKVGTTAGISDDIENLRVNRSDFLQALNDVKPAFGVSEEELTAVIQNGIIHFDAGIEKILQDGRLFVSQVRTSTRIAPRVSVLLHGPPGSGKTAIAASIAQYSEFPFIKLISSDKMVGFSESQKISAMDKVFSDSYKSPMSVVVVDGIERLIEWSPIGPRFSNPVLQALMVLMSRAPPKGHRLLVLATTSLRPMVTELQLGDVFDAEIRVPAISTLNALARVMQDVRLFRTSEELQRCLDDLSLAGFGEEGRLNVGVKKLLSLMEMAGGSQEDDPAARLVSSLMQLSY